MELQPESTERPLAASLKATYRALLARGLEAGEAANLTAFLHGLPSAGFRWSLAEIEAIIHRRILYAADQRAVARAKLPGTAGRRGRPGATVRRVSHSRSTHVSDQPIA